MPTKFVIQVGKEWLPCKSRIFHQDDLCEWSIAATTTSLGRFASQCKRALVVFLLCERYILLILFAFVVQYYDSLYFASSRTAVGFLRTNELKAC